VPRFIVHQHAVLPSTMDAARAAAHDGAPDGTVVVAGQQTQGRGRQGRDWFSPEGNLYASILLRPGLPPARLSELGFIVAQAGSVLSQASAHRAQITQLLRDTWFTPTGWGEALYVPPVPRGWFLRSAVAWERTGSTLSAPFAGVPLSSPVVALKVAQAGLFWMLKVSGAPSASLAVGVNA